MHPTTPDLLNRLLAQAERSLRRPSGDLTAIAVLAELEAEIELQATLPCEGEPLIDDATLMLAKCLRLMEEDSPLGKRRMKFELLAKAFLPWVKTDAALALDRSRPSTSEGAARR